ncbi:Dyp-type peroxidase [Blastococcus sp. Marseille-P5729]|uniref:Dyp-type peroxidase n=1 Tax=Blastococcus sp. Marseille-P5729 TaxID=2086582 RepID=UPI000D0E7870|nr:Dyp-type peroxidase [Blastococcus sp. Marseille-P5729]
MAADTPLARRGFLGAVLGGTALAAGGAGLGAGLAVAEPLAEPSRRASDPAAERPGMVTFHGAHQAGIETAPQSQCVAASYDVRPEIDQQRFVAALGLITDDLERITQGHPALGDTAPMLAENPARLTVTVGVGPALLQRYGIAGPPGFADLPAFPSIDQLDPAYCGGDLMLLIAGDDSLRVAHALRMLSKDLRSFATVRWTQRGFLERDPGEHTPRNLFGQVDGTVNPKGGSEEFDSSVWIDGGSWAGGTTLVVRRIRMEMDSWDELDPAAMEAVIGRRLHDGSPLTGSKESDVPDLDAIDKTGLPVIRSGAHVRLAKADSPGAQMLRRPFSYDDSGAGGTDMGLIFLAYQASIAEQYVPVQQRLADADLLNEWTTPVGSAVFAILPGCHQGQVLGEGIFT